MFNSGNPLDDAIEHSNWLFNQPSDLALSVKCDLCGSEHDKIDAVPCLFEGYYYCEDCVRIGDVASYVRRELTEYFDKQVIENYINKLNQIIR